MLTGNQWKFITFVWRSVNSSSGPFLGIYVNGEPVSVQTNFSSSAPFTTPFGPPLNGMISVGSDNTGGRNADSNIDELSIYDYALTESEIDQVYKNYLGNSWYHHRYVEWMEPEVNTPYQPKRDSAGIILENRAIFDEAPFFTHSGVDSVISKIKQSNFNIYVANVWNGNGMKVSFLN